jgi:hypothetical protein
MFSDPLVTRLGTFVRSIAIEVQACTINWIRKNDPRNDKKLPEDCFVSFGVNSWIVLS